MSIILRNILTKRLFFLWRNALESTKENLKEQLSKPSKFYFTDKGGFILLGESTKTFDKIIDTLKAVDDVAQKFSNEYLEEIMNKAIVELLGTEKEKIHSEIKAQIDHILETLATPSVDWTMIIPIVNLETTVEEFEIGRVRFVRFEKTNKQKLQSKFMKTYKKKNVESGLHLLDKSLEEFDCKVVAEVTILAVDSKRAEEAGIRTINAALDILRFYRLNYNFQHPYFARNDFNVQGNTTSAKQPLVLYSSSGASFPQTWKGFLRPFTITVPSLKAIQNDALNVTSDILKKNNEDMTSFEKDLVSSIRFCALSTRDEQITNAFVNSIISLEALLLGEREAIADNLAERVALIIGHDLNERNWFFDEMKRLYRIRCNIVHSGDTDIRLSDLMLLQRSFSYRCIVNLLKSYKAWNIQTTSDLISWVRNQKFS